MKKRPAKQVIASWSGGKDCCLALHRAIAQGCEVKALLNLVAESTGRCCFHGVDGGLLRLQAESMGIPLVQQAVPDDMKDYERDFKAALKTLRGIDAMVFGDIYLDEHKDWVERVCREAGIEALEPLWNQDPTALFEEFVDAGFEAVIVTCKADVLGREFAGRRLDRAMLKDLKARGVCPCGEKGEYHTVVLDGPLFKRRIRITESEPLLRDGFWQHWALDVRHYQYA